jgi:hypothetical protein
MSPLQNAHRFISVNGTLVRTQISHRLLSLPVTLSSRTLFLRNNTVTNARDTHDKFIEVEIMPGEQISEAFPVFRAEIIDYDTVQIQLTLEADFDGIEGIAFGWAFANPSPSKYARAVKILASLLIGYFLIFFLARADGAHTFHEALGILVGVTGITASNPFGLLQSGSSRLMDYFLMALYFGLFRMCCLSQLELVRSQRSSPGVVFAMLSIIFFTCYVATDSTVSYEQGKRATESEFIFPAANKVESRLLFAHAAYFGAAAIWLFMACYSRRKAGGARLTAFGFFILCDFFATGFSQIYSVRTKTLALTIFPSMLQAIVNMAAGALALFLMHSPDIFEREVFTTEEDKPQPRVPE